MSEGIHHLPRMGISSASRLYGLTHRALRFYEERGLIEARRDRYGVRFYDAEARRRLEWIGRLRRVGVGLADLPAILDAETPAEAQALALAAAERRVQALQAELDSAVAAVSELSAATTPSTPTRSAAVAR